MLSNALQLVIWWLSSYWTPTPTSTPTSQSSSTTWWCSAILCSLPAGDHNHIEMLCLSIGDELNKLPMPTVDVEVYNVWWDFDTDTFPPLSYLTFPHWWWWWRCWRWRRPSRLIGGRHLWGRDVTPTGDVTSNQRFTNLLMEGGNQIHMDFQAKYI